MAIGTDVDAQTIQQAQHGDREAQSKLLRALGDIWYRMSLSLLRDPEAARDATQETALRFLKRLPSYRGQSQLRTWSLGIAINVVREMRRSRTEPDPQAMLRLRPAEPSPVETSAQAEEADALRAVLNELPERQREAIVLRFFEELSVEQTAAAMNCATGTVKATIHQALRSLRKRLGTMLMI